VILCHPLVIIPCPTVSAVTNVSILVTSLCARPVLFGAAFYAVPVCVAISSMICVDCIVLYWPDKACVLAFVAR
jgi:hypothetical protein